MLVFQGAELTPRSARAASLRSRRHHFVYQTALMRVPRNGRRPSKRLRHEMAMATTQDHKRSGERLRHAFWSGLISLVLAVFFLAPLDQIVWSMQAVSAKFHASGSLVFVGTATDPTDPSYPHRREELARTIDQLRKAGAKSVYVDMAFEQPSLPQSDHALNSALRRFGPGAFLVRSVKAEFGNEITAFESNTQAVGKGVAQVGGQRMFYYFGIVWTTPYTVEFGGTKLVNAAASMAGVTSDRGEFPINYGFILSSIPRDRLQALADLTPAQLQARFRGKQVVIGKVGRGAEFAIPGHPSVPGGLLHIFAAESLKAGYVGSLPLFPIWLFGFAVLLFAALMTARGMRRACYLALVLSLPVCFLITMHLGIRPSMSVLALLLVSYFAFRVYARSKKGVLLVDQKTGLPTFAALEGDRKVARRHPAIIVAKMHRFEEVRQTLPIELHAEYILRIIDRLNAASPDTRIYQGPGHSIAWCVTEDDPTLHQGSPRKGCARSSARPCRSAGRRSMSESPSASISVQATNVARRLSQMRWLRPSAPPRPT